MIITKAFTDWYEAQDDDTRKSVYNFCMLVFTTMRLRDRLALAFEILMGRRYCLMVSQDQEPVDK